MPTGHGRREGGADEAKGFGLAMGGDAAFLIGARTHDPPPPAFHDRHARDAIRHRNFATSHGPKVQKGTIHKGRPH